MKRILGIGFYWGKTKILRLKLDRPELEWHMELYGISIKNTFLGIMVRGKRTTVVRELGEKELEQSWKGEVDRQGGAFTQEEINRANEWH